MTKRCPKCGSDLFIVKAVVLQEWVVNEAGLHKETYNDFVNIVQEATDSDTWECYKCHLRTKGKLFNIEE